MQDIRYARCTLAIVYAMYFTQAVSVDGAQVVFNGARILHYIIRLIKTKRAPCTFLYRTLEVLTLTVPVVFYR